MIQPYIQVAHNPGENPLRNPSCRILKDLEGSCKIVKNVLQNLCKALRDFQRFLRDSNF